MIRLSMALAAAILVMMAASAQAQEPAADAAEAQITAPENAEQKPAPKLGMASWAFWVAEGSEMAVVATQEIAFAHFGVYDKFVGKRLASGAASLALPIAMRWILRKAPRSSANVEAVIIGAWGTFGASQNIKILVTIHPVRR